ncbi:unnamed protein product [Protopolystoma xenopodis]|uniref:Uncharacterized protein n=1 Tax=Protopolystoma xenopodis TaxID=117903 RepID=A0A3S5ALK6_9PLAT|nr:unnamed protein product [Protopolystoma xenopodis]
MAACRLAIEPLPSCLVATVHSRVALRCVALHLLVWGDHRADGTPKSPVHASRKWTLSLHHHRQQTPSALALADILTFAPGNVVVVFAESSERGREARIVRKV